MIKTIIRVICLGIVAAGSPAVVAAPVYLAQVGVVPSPGTALFDGGTPSAIATTAFGFVFTPIDFVSAPNIVVTGSSVGEGTALADNGTLKVFSRAAQSAQGGTLGFYSNRIRTNSRAQFMLDDLVIMPLAPGNPQQFVSLTLRFSIGGLMPVPDAQGHIFDTALISNFPTQTFATAETNLSLHVALRDPTTSLLGDEGGSVRIRTSATNAAGTVADITSLLGVFFGHDADLQNGGPFIAETTFIGVPVGRPLELTVSLSSIAESILGFPQNGGVWQGEGVVHFDNSLTFATDAVATLPAGFTLNSAGGRIVDNVWAPVPLPGTLPLLATGFLSVLLRRVRKRK